LFSKNILHTHMLLSSYGGRPRGRGTALTPTKGKASDANTIQATSDNIEAVGNEISVHIGPRKARPNLDSLTTFADGDVIEPGHRDVYTCGRRKAWVGGVSTTFHCEWDAIFGYLLKLYLLA
jgi:hypothetical protein